MYHLASPSNHSCASFDLMLNGYLAFCDLTGSLTSVLNDSSSISSSSDLNDSSGLNGSSSEASFSSSYLTDSSSFDLIGCFFSDLTDSCSQLLDSLVSDLIDSGPSFLYPPNVEQTHLNPPLRLLLLHLLPGEEHLSRLVAAVPAAC